MSKIKVVHPEEHLYHRYYNQSTAQETFLDLDPERGTLEAGYNPEVGTCMPGAVWHGTIRRYALYSSALSATAIGYLMDKVAPLCERVMEGFESEWNGSNHVGVLDCDAQKAEEEIAEILNEMPDNSDYIAVEDAADWLDEERDQIEEDVAMAKANKTDESPDEIVQRYIDEGNDIDVVDDLDGFVESVVAAAVDHFCYAVEKDAEVLEAFWAPNDDAAKRYIDQHVVEPTGSTLVTIDVVQLAENAWDEALLPEEGTRLEIDDDGCATVIE